MALQISPLGPCIGAVASGIDLREPLSAENAEAIHHAMDRYAVLVFHDQPLTNELHLAFTQALGPLEDTARNTLRRPEDQRLPQFFADVSNLNGQNKPFAREDRKRLFAIGNRLWHSDSSFKAVPAKYSLLRALSVPSKGGNTEFAHMGAAYEALDDETKAVIEPLICEHSQLFSRDLIGFREFSPEERERFKPVRQRLVRTLPRTGRKSIYLSSHAGTILGWELPEARLLLRDLMEHATQREFVYSHQWRVNDLVMWDNRQTMHRGRPFPVNEARDVRRTTLKGEGMTVAQDDPVSAAA
jgi:alpha-ketoglutarate-dependent 2,4-dichlorophenoxyacetate dioxygenase